MDVRAGKRDYYVTPFEPQASRHGGGQRFSLGTKRGRADARAAIGSAKLEHAIVWRDNEGGPVFTGWRFYADEHAAKDPGFDFEALSETTPEDDEPTPEAAAATPTSSPTTSSSSPGPTTAPSSPTTSSTPTTPSSASPEATAPSSPTVATSPTDPKGS